MLVHRNPVPALKKDVGGRLHSILHLELRLSVTNTKSMYRKEIKQMALRFYTHRAAWVKI